MNSKLQITSLPSQLSESFSMKKIIVMEGLLINQIDRGNPSQRSIKNSSEKLNFKRKKTDPGSHPNWLRRTFSTENVNNRRWFSYMPCFYPYFAFKEVDVAVPPLPPKKKKSLVLCPCRPSRLSRRDPDSGWRVLR